MDSLLLVLACFSFSIFYFCFATDQWQNQIRLEILIYFVINLFFIAKFQRDVKRFFENRDQGRSHIIWVWEMSLLRNELQISDFKPQKKILDSCFRGNDPKKEMQILRVFVSWW